MNNEVGHFMVHVINFESDGLPTQFKSGFQKLFRLEIITDTGNKVKLHVIMDLFSQNNNYATKNYFT